LGAGNAGWKSWGGFGRFETIGRKEPGTIQKSCSGAGPEFSEKPSTAKNKRGTRLWVEAGFVNRTAIPADSL
jgi:hypothetical protein